MTKIIIDADVISHFITGGYIHILPKIFDFEIVILDKVYRELERTPKRKKEVDNIINWGLFKKIPFPQDNNEIIREYMYLKSKMFKGEGESACMAYVRYTENVLASSNLRDISNYCKMHKLKYLTTMDFLHQALTKEILTNQQCNEFLERTRKAKQRLPVDRIEDFIPQNAACLPL